MEIKINNGKLVCGFVMIGILLLITCALYLATREVEAEVVKCYDANNREILGVECYQEATNFSAWVKYIPYLFFAIGLFGIIKLINNEEGWGYYE